VIEEMPPDMVEAVRPIVVTSAEEIRKAIAIS